MSNLNPPLELLELLAPAKTAAIGRDAVTHGADAVYIGGPSFGARDKAGNAMEDIAGLVEFAHRYRAKIFVTLNTILHDAELEAARKLAWDCYDAGVDALIVQDMGLLELDLPPIALHASTQCDIRTPEKARFLADVGFSQIVLARELTISEIVSSRASTICEKPTSARNFAFSGVRMSHWVEACRSIGGRSSSSNPMSCTINASTPAS